jgi:hypothetical protein
MPASDSAARQRAGIVVATGQPRPFPHRLPPIRRNAQVTVFLGLWSSGVSDGRL